MAAASAVGAWPIQAVAAAWGHIHPARVPHPSRGLIRGLVLVPVPILVRVPVRVPILAQDPIPAPVLVLVLVLARIRQAHRRRRPRTGITRSGMRPPSPPVWPSPRR